MARRTLPIFGVLAAVAAALSGCERSVAMPPGGATFVTELEADPAFVQANEPFELVFRLLGGTPEEVAYVVGSDRVVCTPVARSDGRVACMHPGLDRSSFAEGPVAVRVEAEDDGGATSARETVVNLDVTCPRAAAASVTPSQAEPGTTVTVTVEASEPLSGAPTISRLGRDWGVAVGEDRTWTLERVIGEADPTSAAPISIVLEDRAGNRNQDCGSAIELAFSVDQRRPVIDPSRVFIDRGAPGVATTVTASAGAFSDDVGVVEVRVYEPSSGTLAGTLVPNADGSLDTVSLGTQLSSRLQIEAVDAFGRTSARQSPVERWRLSLGTGSIPGVALRTGTRFTAPGPGTTAMRDLTVASAPDVARVDARSLVVRAQVGFHKVGDLPSFYQDVHRAYVGYDPKTQTVVSAGGFYGNNYYTYYDEGYVPEVLSMAWDAREGTYIVERLPDLSYTDSSVPPPGYGGSIAFDGTGCGVLYGGIQRIEESRDTTTADLWELCSDASGAQTWRQISVPDTIGATRLNRSGPIIWDPAHQRYVAAGNAYDDAAEVVTIEPGSTTSDWQVRLLGPLPTSFTTRYGGFLFYDPRIEGFSVGLGTIGQGTAYSTWTYADDAWRVGRVPPALSYMYRLGSAFDEARGLLAVWGGILYPDDPPESSVWYLTQTATVGPEGWRQAEVNRPALRNYPSMVYNPDRQTIVMFGGVRFDTNLSVEPEIYELISQPAFPYAQIEVELGTERPKGVERISLSLRASGVGDADGIGSGTASAPGVAVVLWDYEQGAWTSAVATSQASGLTDLEITLTDRPERFIDDSGRLAVALRSLWPATEARDARLEVDLFDGELLMRPGVQLP